MEQERLPDIEAGKEAGKKDNSKKKVEKKKRSNFFKEVVIELKKVAWPSKKDVIKATGVVVALAIVLGGVVGGFDALFSYLIGLIVG